MKLTIGTKIRELRRRDSRTQEDLASALGVTAQAVSRWESGGSYPDMEIVPSIANFFGVSIDELFGYHGERDAKIDAILAKIASFNLKHDGDDGWVDECTAILREGLAEFPGNERLLITLAETLWEAGWRRHGDWIGYDENGRIQYCYDREKKNPYWAEAGKICLQLTENSGNHDIYHRAIAVLVPLYRNYGEYDRAAAYAERMPELNQCREYLLSEATDGIEEAGYIGEFLLKSAKEFSEQMVFGLITDLSNFGGSLPVEKVKGAIALFDLIREDGNFGAYHDFVLRLYLYLSRLQWENGEHDDAFASLDAALHHARAYEAFADGEEHRLTAPLVRYVNSRAEPIRDLVKNLPDEWPFWCNPYYREIKAEMEADPRWTEWVSRCKK